MIFKKMDQEQLAIGPHLVRVLEGILRINHEQLGPGRNPQRKTPMMAPLRPKLDDYRVGRRSSIQLSFHSRRFVTVDRVETHSELRQMLVAVDVPTSVR
jgi:hypothetical protein